MADPKNIDKSSQEEPIDDVDPNIAVSTSDVCSVSGSVKTTKTQHISTTSERQVKFERAQKALENAALVSKRIKEHRKATAELLGRPFEEEDVGETAEIASTMSERTGYSVATDTSTNLSVQDALNIPGISESLANTLKQKELLMERIKLYKERSKRPIKTAAIKRDSGTDSKLDFKKMTDNNEITQLINTIKEKENTLSVMQVKMKAMETTILDLQEKINEKDQIIEAKNMATTLMSDSLSKKEKDSLHLLEDTRQQMSKMQDNFVSMENEWREEKLRLMKEIELKNEKIHSLEEANTILENTRFEITVAHSKLLEELELKNKEISELQERLHSLSKEPVQEVSSKDKEEFEEEKGTLEISNMVELTKKVELLEQINCQIRQTNIELENKLANLYTESKSSTSSPSKKASPLPTRKGGRNTASKTKSPWSNLSSEPTPETEKKTHRSEIAKLEMLVQSLNKDILDKEYLIAQKNALISELQSTNTTKETEITELKTMQKSNLKMIDIGTDMVDIGVTKPDESESEKSDEKLILVDQYETEQSTNVSELEQKLADAEKQITALNEEIDLANKNMIKVKSNHKLKLKQMQKTIDNFSKISDSNAEIVKLNEEVHQLSQKVAELEEEKGNLQLHLVDYDSGRLTESDVYKKMVEMENLAETRLKAISVLESQKFDLVQELHILQQKNMEMEDKLADMSQLQNEQVCSEMKSVQLEEQIDELTAVRKELELIIENLKLDNEHLNGTIKLLHEEKEELVHKLENYIQENMELTDKLEKLSAEKVSSAESIEIVESLTTQEKLELEQYNKGMIESKPVTVEESYKEDKKDKNVDSLIEQTTELNKRIELFTQERQEVMDKMQTISSENEKLHTSIAKLENECSTFKQSIEILNHEKQELQQLNTELSRQIEELKREHIEIMKETVEIPKPAVVEEALESMADPQNDEKSTGEKGINRTKSVKQLTKEILKLKNTIKEREAEIADCQMKILSLEEQHQKQIELIQTNSLYESKVKTLTDENQILKDKLENMMKYKESEEQLLQLKQANKSIQEELQKTHQEFSNIIAIRDSRINELENLLVEYEKQIFNYGNTLQQKDKDMVEYINQITKLNDVSQKLKSTIELLEEEKAKDQNAELIKSLNKQIAAYQKKLAECEEKLNLLEEEKNQLLSIKTTLENKNVTIDTELKKLQESFIEKQNMIKELQAQQQKYSEEVSNVMLEAKERDEEIHEIKLQLRKESIENEKLRTVLSEKDKTIDEFSKIIEETKEKVNNLLNEKAQLSDQVAAAETKNKELMEKLKKFAVSIKKKSSMYNELENQLHDLQKELEIKNLQLEQLSIQVDTLPALQEKFKHAEEEINRLQAQKIMIEQNKSQEVTQLNEDLKSFEEKLNFSSQEISKLNEALNNAYKDLQFARDENMTLKLQIDTLNNKLVEHEIEQKNSSNLITKISTMEGEIDQKQTQITELLHKLESQEQMLNQLNFGHEAKIQERDLYIENLETEINKYKNRICRLEESISIMEDRRHSLERKADQLDSQLQEKQKAYSDYSSQEDELINRLAVLMDHDRVLEKQLHEIEHENRQLQDKIQYMVQENQHLRKSVSDFQDNYNSLIEKANRADAAESEIIKYQIQLKELEVQFKKNTQEHNSMILKKKQDIEELEMEFNTQIENAIREKKNISEKYEKICEHLTQLENKLQEYRSENESLKINMEELNRVNQDILEKATRKEQSLSPDYTEQYINEINKLNALVNNKSQEIEELKNQLYTLKVNGVATVSNLESRINDLTSKLQQSTEDVDQLVNEINTLKNNNDQLQNIVIQKDEQIKELKDRKKVSFEMNIPKTEGMIISSTIEAINVEEPPKYNIGDLESQIVPDIPSQVSDTKKPVIESEPLSNKAPVSETDSKSVMEEVIVPKKAYLCYKGEEEIDEKDPFNSEEGWGFGESEEAVVIPGLTILNEKISTLQKENETLKKDLELNNIKLLKVIKKFKELKANNEMLSNELKLSKQLSQSSFLDNAIEDELRSTIQALEKKVEELKADLNKEKREKEAIKKQNEVFNNANEKFIEMKEKLDNEVELWKYKFKQVNDKLSTLQWGADNKDIPEHKDTTSTPIEKDNSLKEEFLKLEKENDELQSLVDQLTTQNSDLLTQQTNLKNEINNLNQQLQSEQFCKNCSNLNSLIKELEDKNTELSKYNEILKEKVCDLETRCCEIMKSYDNLKINHEDMLNTYESNKDDMARRISSLENKLRESKNVENEYEDKLEYMKSELELLKEKLHVNETQQRNDDSMILSEKYFAMEEQYLQLKQQYEVSINKLTELEKYNETVENKLEEYEAKISDLNLKIQQLTNEKEQLLLTITELQSTNSNTVKDEMSTQDLKQKISVYENQVLELNTKIQKLNTENDQLLSTVAELRSSVSSAVDQRGFEIAELWKQHLAQREADFLKLEQELRSELSASEAKYEQLLDNVQSSSQEETNKLIMMEQVTSLQSKLQDKEDHLRNLQDKYAEVLNQLDLLRSEFEDEKVMYENKLLGQQEEYEKIIKDSTVKNEQDTQKFEESFKKLQSELSTTKAINEELTQQFGNLNVKIQELEETVLDLKNQVRLKEAEIYQKTHEYSIALAQRNEEFENVRKQLLDFEKKVEDITYEKESELAVLRLKMHENSEHYGKIQTELESEKRNLVEVLNAKIIECTNLNKQVADLNQSIEEHVSKASEMQTALENQELEIVTLKDEILTLEQMMRKTSNRIEKHVTFATDTKSSEDGEKNEGLLNKALLDAVPRAELDLATYMLHQRDVRCEELTMELTQLLEERDTLQLRLSDCLRSNEELKSKLKAAALDISTDSQETIADLSSISTDNKGQQFVDTHRGQTSRSSSVSEVETDKPKLEAKLSELRTVRHSRDVRLRQESEQRQMDLRLLQRDVENLPAEAVDQLVQAHHTLSRDSQSTSTVLLNWLRGKSTPKVVHM